MTTRALILGKVLQINNSVYYPACKTCYSKVHIASDVEDCNRNRNTCLKCGLTRDSTEVIQRYKLSLHITDGYSNCDVTVFGTQLEQFLGASAQHLHAYLQWMERNNVHSILLSAALQQVFCDNWFLFGFKLSKPTSQKKNFNLRDVTGLSETQQTQCGLGKPSVIAWQMTRVCEKQLSDINVISVLRQLVHEQLRRRHTQHANVHDDVSQRTLHEDTTSLGLSDISLVLCPMGSTIPHAASQSSTRSISRSGIDLSNNTTHYHSITNDRSKLIRSNVASGSDSNFIHTLSGPVIDTADTSGSNISLHSQVDGTYSDQSTMIIRVCCDDNVSIELQRQGTQNTTQSQLMLDFKSLDFSTSFNESSTSHQYRLVTNDVSHNITRDMSEMRISQLPNADITNERTRHDLISQIDVCDQDETYYNLNGDCDETIDVMHHFRKACDATQTLKPDNIQNLKSAATISHTVEENSSHSPSLNADIGQDINEESFNDSSLLLQCSDGFDSSNEPKNTDTQNENIVNAVPHSTSDTSAKDEFRSKYDYDSENDDTMNDSSLLLCVASDKADAILEDPYVNTDKAEFVDQQMNDVQPGTSVSNELVESCPFSEDQEAFLNDESSVLEQDSVSQNCTVVAAKVSTIRTKTSTYQYQHESEKLPYSEDLVQFLEDMDNDSMNVSCATNVNCNNILRIENPSSVSHTTAKEKPEDNSLTENIGSKQMANVSAANGRDQSKCRRSATPSDGSLDLPYSEDLDQFLEDLNEDSMNSMCSKADCTISNNPSDTPQHTAISSPVKSCDSSSSRGNSPGVKRDIIYCVEKEIHASACSTKENSLHEIVNNAVPDSEELFSQQVEDTKETIEQPTYRTTSGPHLEITKTLSNAPDSEDMFCDLNGSDNNSQAFQTSPCEHVVSATGLNTYEVNSEEMFSQGSPQCNERGIHSSEYHVNNDTSLPPNNSCISNASDDLFGDSYDNGSILGSISQTKSYRKHTPDRLNVYSVQGAHKPKSVHFNPVLIQRELISNVDHQMQTTPYRTPMNIRRRSSLRLRILEHQQFQTSLKSITKSPCGNYISTPSPSLQNILKSNHAILQSTPVILDNSNASLFSSPDTSVINNSQEESILKTKCVLSEKRFSELDSEASLFSNDDSIQNSINLGSALQMSNKDSIDEMFSSSDESDFIPCSQAIVRTRKFMIA